MLPAEFSMKHKILIVEDDPIVRNLLYTCLSETYDCTTAESAESALMYIVKNNYSLIISDIALPKMNGLELMNKVSQMNGDTLFLVMSAETKIENAIDALRLGAFDYLIKPLDFPKIKLCINRAIEHYELKMFKTEHERKLEDLVRQRTTQYDYALEEVDSAYRATLKALVHALETKVFEPIGHHDRVVTYSLRLGCEIGLNESELRSLELGALLHDIGKIGVSNEILRKIGKLNDVEKRKMQMHPLYGEEILREIPFLEGAIRVVVQHHEWWNGCGYPKQLKGSEIDFNARIFSVIDAFDAITSDRTYRAALTFEAAKKEIISCSGTQFDPLVVEVFCDIPKAEWENLFLNRQGIDHLSFQPLVAELIGKRTDDLLSEMPAGDFSNLPLSM